MGASGVGDIEAPSLCGRQKTYKSFTVLNQLWRYSDSHTLLSRVLTLDIWVRLRAEPAVGDAMDGQAEPVATSGMASLHGWWLVSMSRGVLPWT